MDDRKAPYHIDYLLPTMNLIRLVFIQIREIGDYNIFDAIDAYMQTSDIRAKMDELMAKRVDKQPLDKPSAGSTFKRPAGYFAGTLIEGCGLKGCRVGGAEVSPKHAGFVVNVGGATCADVLALIEKVRKTVYDAHGVMLEPEVKIIR